MTLGMAWLRTVGNIRELVIASDSRLSGGQHWDANPKIMLLPRTDAVLSFAGNTWDAYPLMLQAYNSIKMHLPASSRAMDLEDLKGHLVRVFNHSRKFISGLPQGQKIPDDPEAIFVLSGFSWKNKAFKVWTLHYDRSIQGFTFRPAKEWGGQAGGTSKLIAYAGDNEPITAAKERLISLLRDRGKLNTGSFNMEPFEVLRDLIREGRHPTIGGSVQLVKIYEHANAVPVGVYWPSKGAGIISVLGRPLMNYERTPWGVIDPDAPDRAYPAHGLDNHVIDE
ncbi:hypothetical protein HFO21_03510 [Rhizobium laguerreae]|uniref:hypothetical protein n=1 Tax=Rhizobium laguerreae TaxID=1076926 RepID=UPI001C9136B6|nr:hypothetical protein [Rhizobium laguerreae]MBY3213479.1 hypothetical protein [Rhizobium laguerreae]